jgi:hypothetical protein
LVGANWLAPTLRNLKSIGFQDATALPDFPQIIDVTICLYMRCPSFNELRIFAFSLVLFNTTQLMSSPDGHFGTPVDTPNPGLVG